MGSSPGANLRMQLAREARVVAGITLFAAPTIVYSGITSVGMLTKGTAGFAPGHGQEARRLQAWRLRQPGWSPRQLDGGARRQRRGRQPEGEACPGRRSGVPPAPPTARCPTVTDDRPAGATAPTLAARPRRPMAYGGHSGPTAGWPPSCEWQWAFPIIHQDDSPPPPQGRRRWHVTPCPTRTPAAFWKMGDAPARYQRLGRHPSARV